MLRQSDRYDDKAWWKEDEQKGTQFKLPFCDHSRTSSTEQFRILLVQVHFFLCAHTNAWCNFSVFFSSSFHAYAKFSLSFAEKIIKLMGVYVAEHHCVVIVANTEKHSRKEMCFCAPVVEWIKCKEEKNCRKLLAVGVVGEWMRSYW